MSLKLNFLSIIAVLVLCSSLPSFAGYEKNYIGDMEEYTAVYEDTLVHLARKHNLGFVELRAANPDLDPWIPGAGAKIILPKRHLLPDAPREGLVINLPEMRIYGFLNGDDAPFSYPLGVGREGLDTPTGITKIVRKKVAPTWRPTKRMLDADPKLPAVVPPGPDNPLGTHALYLDWPTYAIHGTTKPYGIGRRVSSGCIRLYPESIIELFKRVPVGTKVNVVNQPIKVAWIGNELYLEAHPDMEQSIKMEETGNAQNKKLSAKDMELITDRAGMYADRLNWPRIRMAVRERKGYPIRIARYFDDKAMNTTISDDNGEKLENTNKIEERADSNNIENGDIANKENAIIPVSKPVDLVKVSPKVIIDPKKVSNNRSSVKHVYIVNN